MPNAADFPNPNGPKPAGISDRAWKSYTEINSTIPLGQWTAWEGQVDPSCPSSHPYKGTKTLADGSLVGGCGESPANCPDGTTAYGQNQCMPIDSPQVQGSWNIDPRSGTAGPKNGTAAAPAPTAPLTSAETAPQTLQGALMQMFKDRSGAFGFLGGRTPQGQLAGDISVDQYGKPLPTAPKLGGSELKGGGMLWSDAGTDLSDWGAGTPPPATAGGSYQPPKQDNMPAALSAAMKPTGPTTTPASTPGYPGTVNGAMPYWQSSQNAGSTIGAGMGGDPTLASSLAKLFPTTTMKTATPPAVPPTTPNLSTWKPKNGNTGVTGGAGAGFPQLNQ